MIISRSSASVRSVSAWAVSDRPATPARATSGRARRPGHLVARAPVDDHVLGRRAHGAAASSAIGLHRHGLAAAEEAIGGEQGLGVGVGQAGGDRAGAVAGEERQDDPADLGDCQQGDDDLRRHGHEQANCIALAQSQRAQGVGHRLTSPIQVAVG